MDMRVLDLVGAIYDAALDPGRWPDALSGVCDFVPGTMGNIFSQDSLALSVNRMFTWGDDPHYTQAYMSTYAPLNPLFPTGMFFPLGEVYSSADIMPLDLLRQSRFAQEWLAPQGYVDFIAANMERTATGMVALTVVRHRDQGIADDESKARVAMLVPHVHRAMTIGRTLELAKAEAETMADVVDGLSAALFLVTADCRLAHANRAGVAMLDDKRIARIASGRIAFGETGRENLLEPQIARASEGDAAIGTGGIASPLGRFDDEEFVAYVLPLTSHRRARIGKAYAASAAVFIQKASIDFKSPLALISERYKLTGGEVRALSGLLAGDSVKDAAVQLGVAESTMRSHLHKLFEKTGTSRQTDLIKLVTGFSGPIG
jgi:DNA-binding CsgD family transcriptional regulator